MKMKPILLIVAALLLCIYGCKKRNNSPVSIVGKWSIVKTVYLTAKDTTINGKATDYYIFGEDGSLAIANHDGSFTGIYSLKATDSVGITIYTVDGHGMGVITAPAVYTISNLTSHSVTLTSPPYPSGQETVFLKR